MPGFLKSIALKKKERAFLAWGSKNLKWSDEKQAFVPIHKYSGGKKVKQAKNAKKAKNVKKAKKA